MKQRQDSLGPQSRQPDREINLSFEGREEDGASTKAPPTDADFVIPLGYHDLAKPKSFKNFLQNLAACHEHSFSDQKQNDPSASYHFLMEYLQLLIMDENTHLKLKMEQDDESNFLKVSSLSKAQVIQDL